MSQVLDQVLAGLAVGANIRGTATKDCLIAAGPLSKQPGTMPYRVVLVVKENEFCVYSEIFSQQRLPQASFDHAVSDNVPESHLESGNYYRSDSLVEAVERFAERVKQHAGYLQSLYRVVQV